ncbi:hypothetical protein K1719_023667 [Acacia pycnantha]|nr:hypothetical protein K1719_023667 [Acacia pycnantha]
MYMWRASEIELHAVRPTFRCFPYGATATATLTSSDDVGDSLKSKGAPDSEAFVAAILGPTNGAKTRSHTSLLIILSSLAKPYLSISFHLQIMLLKAAASSLSLSSINADHLGSLFSSFSPFNSTASLSSILPFSPGKNGGALVLCASKSGNNRPLTGVLFEPFQEIKKDTSFVPDVPQVSLARRNFSDECEAAINEQINVEYNVAYVYHAMFAYFDRDNVALKGLAKFFRESSDEERDHAEKLMKYQNKRGGKVTLQSIVMPLSEYDHDEKGDALYAMELALSLEKLTNEKLLNLHSFASKNNDAQLADFIESEFLGEQVEAIKRISEYVAQLRRVNKGHGVWHFDQTLLHEEAAHGVAA